MRRRAFHCGNYADRACHPHDHTRHEYLCLSGQRCFWPAATSKIFQFAKNVNGSATPVSSITGSASIIFDTVAEDAGGNLYVGGYTYNVSPNTAPGVINILEYFAGATGPATSLRNISGSATGLQQLSINPIFGLDLDAAPSLKRGHRLVSIGENRPMHVPASANVETSIGDLY